ncbi:hypothetical protein ACSVBT_18910 [Afipia sp. TerB]
MLRDGSRISFAKRKGRIQLVRTLALGFSIAVSCIGHAQAEEDDAKSASSWPTTYLDLNTQFSAIPANSLSFGLGPIGFLSTASSRNLVVNAPLTVDVTDRFSVYGGITALTYQLDGTSWSPFYVASWNVGFTADVIEQDGAIPKLTLQSTYTKTIGSSVAVLSAATLSTVVEAGHAFDEDETRGVLAGVQLVNAFVSSSLIRVEPDVVVYGGGYYQWPSNWKFTGRAGVQHFGGARIANLLDLRPFTQPVARFNLDKLDDNDNRLFGVAFEVAWTPKPAFQFTVHTPLYAVRK